MIDLQLVHSLLSLLSLNSSVLCFPCAVTNSQTQTQHVEVRGTKGKRDEVALPFSLTPVFVAESLTASLYL